MNIRSSGSAMSAAASELRTIIRGKEDGEFLGDEREVIQLLGISRTTLRQVARLLEREGLLKVKRGSSGGYYAHRPSQSSVESAVIDYLESVEVRSGELTTMASVIWTEAVRQASSLASEEAAKAARKLAKAVRAAPIDLSYHELITIEQNIRASIFDLIDSPYIKLIFGITVAFGEKRYRAKGESDEAHLIDPQFIDRWRSVKLLECNAIEHGDQELAILAAGRSRELWRAVSQFQLASDAPVRSREKRAKARGAVEVA